jgi:hypothetical protein
MRHKMHGCSLSQRFGCSLGRHTAPETEKEQYRKQHCGQCHERSDVQRVQASAIVASGAWELRGYAGADAAFGLAYTPWRLR